ncbi:MAG: complex I NDUFA9 subunit family protein [Alphaproteobacteria bacterium]|nr:complex I NDUFA9 subunit family protein [Alphaproteobacteria bacterium]
MPNGLVTIFGGSGFIGRYLVKRLAATGRPIRVAVRDPEGGLFLKPMGAVGQVELFAANVRDDVSVTRAVQGAQDVVNLVGILAESGKRSFAAVHADGAGRVARAAREAGAQRLVHASSLGADIASPSRYLRTKAAGEGLVRGAFPGATIVRPSVVFGPEDGFLNRFGATARLSPVLLVLGGGEGPRFQPVYVGDVAEALFRILQRPETAGQTFELGGPEVLSWRALLRMTLRETRRWRPVVSWPWPLSSAIAYAGKVVPMPKTLRVTPDQVRALRRDSVLTGYQRGLRDLGISPTPIETVAPAVLSRYRRNLDAPQLRTL